MQRQSATSPDEPLRRLIGRDPDLQRVRGFIRDASVHGGSLIVRGDAGVGKTSLLEAVAAAASGARVLRAVGSPFEVDVRFAVLSQALSTAHDEIISAPDRQTSDLGAALGLVAARQPSHEATTDETVRLLRRLSRVAPVLVVLDDLQWVDAASADVLAVAAQSLSHEPVAFLAAARSGATTAFDTGGAKEHRLEQLTADNAARLFDARYPHVAT